MEKYKDNSYSTHGHFGAELFIIVFVLLIAVFVSFPKARVAYLKVKMNSAIDGASSYKESVDNFFVSKLLFDQEFKLDGTYLISSGNLVFGDDIYNIPMGGNVPDSGYLSYSNNSLVKGCINIDGYSVLMENGDITTLNDSCDIYSDVALGI